MASSKTRLGVSAYAIVVFAVVLGSNGVRNLIGFYDAGALVDYASLKNVPAWLERGLARPAVQRGLDSPKRAV